MSKRSAQFGLFFRHLTILMFSFQALVALYCLVAAPPLHYFYHKAPSAGPNSVYVPGAGFAGFWYHLGLFRSILGSTDYRFIGSNRFSAIHIDADYYCYSSGCLSLLLAVMHLKPNATDETDAHLDFVYNAARATQDALRNGEIRHFEIVERFLQKSILDPIHLGQVDEEQMLDFLSHLNILITTGIDGVQIKKAGNLVELVDLIIKTTWIPFVTGEGFGRLLGGRTNLTKSTSWDDQVEGLQTVQDWFLDGGFSRRLHPHCEHVVNVPINWKTTIHSLNPGMNREAAMDLYQMGLDDSKAVFSPDYDLEEDRRFHQENLSILPQIFQSTVSRNWF